MEGGGENVLVRSVGWQVEATQGAAALLMVSWAEPHWQV